MTFGPQSASPHSVNAVPSLASHLHFPILLPGELQARSVSTVPMPTEFTTLLGQAVNEDAAFRPAVSLTAQAKSKSGQEVRKVAVQPRVSTRRDPGPATEMKPSLVEPAGEAIRPKDPVGPDSAFAWEAASLPDPQAATTTTVPDTGPSTHQNRTEVRAEPREVTPAEPSPHGKPEISLVSATCPAPLQSSDSTLPINLSPAAIQQAPGTHPSPSAASPSAPVFSSAPSEDKPAASGTYDAPSIEMDSRSMEMKPPAPTATPILVERVPTAPSASTAATAQRTPGQAASAALPAPTEMPPASQRKPWLDPAEPSWMLEVHRELTGSPDSQLIAPTRKAQTAMAQPDVIRTASSARSAGSKFAFAARTANADSEIGVAKSVPDHRINSGGPKPATATSLEDDPETPPDFPIVDQARTKPEPPSGLAFAARLVPVGSFAESPAEPASSPEIPPSPIDPPGLFTTTPSPEVRHDSAAVDKPLARHAMIPPERSDSSVPRAWAADPAPRSVPVPEAPSIQPQGREGSPQKPPILHPEPAEVTTEFPKPAPAAHDIRLQLTGPEQRVEVRMVERGGDVHVAVRTSDSGLAGALRQDLPALSARLEQSGFHAESWHTGSPAPPRQTLTESSPGASPQDQQKQSGQERGREEDRQSSRHQQNQHRKDDRKEFAWLFNSLQ
jgi:hypothetical protein